MIIMPMLLFSYHFVFSLLRITDTNNGGMIRKIIPYDLTGIQRKILISTITMFILTGLILKNSRIYRLSCIFLQL